jgi:hypothetical protein
MGKADNRRTKKTKQNKAQRRLKARAKKIAELVRTARKSGKKDVVAATFSTVRQKAVKG